MAFVQRILTSAVSHHVHLEARFNRTLGPQSSILVRWATKKAGGISKNGRDSPGKRLGVKKFGGEAVKAGNIIIRQRGQKFHSGENVGMGRDHTIYATVAGHVSFRFDHRIKRNIVSVEAQV